jgi:crossover junction endodeoxyribonuclease RusA
MSEGRTWVLPLPYVRPPLSANKRGHWSPAHKEYRAVRDDVIILAKHWRNTVGLAGVGRADVELAWYPGSQRLADSDNISDTLKPVLDGLVKGGVWPDDNWRYVRRTSSIVIPRSEDPRDQATPRVILIIEEVAGGSTRDRQELADGRRRPRTQQPHRANLAHRA